MKFIVYDQDGNIKRTGICPADMLSIQAQENETVMEGEASDILHKIKDGQIADLSDEEKAIKGPVRVTPDPTEVLIQQRMQEILRKQSIDELTKEGKITIEKGIS